MDEIGRSMQLCTECGEAKPFAEFDIRADTGRRRSMCKPCRRAYQRSRWPWTIDPARSTRVIGMRDLYPCTRCRELKPADAFQLRFRHSVIIQSWCRECLRAYRAERHVRLHEREIKRIRRNRQEAVTRNRKLLAAYLVDHPCVDCGETETTVLDFDHLRDKRMDISRMVNTGHAWASILEEIAKCEVRCANDHRRATRKRREEGRTRRLP